MNFLLIIIITLFLSGCECQINIKGQIISNSTGLPLEGVLIDLKRKNVKVISDKYGKFNLEHFGGCFDPLIQITKKGYKPFEIKFSNSDNLNTYKIKNVSKWYEYPTLFYPDSSDSNYSLTGTWISQYSRNFQIKSDSIIIFLDEENINKEIESIKKELQTKKQ